MAYRFGEFRLDVERLELRKNGRRVALHNKPLFLLIYLVVHRDRPVSKNELTREVWGVPDDAAFHDPVIATTIATLRRVLGDRNREKIKTFNNEGYQFRASVTEVPSGPMTEDQVFIDHGGQWADLSQALRLARSGEGSFQLLDGEHGTGKTHLGEQLASVATQQGCCAFSSCLSSGDGQGGLTSWARGFIAHLRRSNPDRLCGLMEPSEADAIAPLVPELYDVFCELVQPHPESVAVPSLEFDQQRQAAVACLARFIHRLAGAQPLVLVFDDLHEADDSLCRLLLALARGLPGTPLLLVGMYRGGALGPRHSLAAALGKLDRPPLLQRKRLTGFSTADVERYIEFRTGGDAAGLAGAVHERTGGNPLFVAKVVSHAIDRGLLDRPADVLRGELPASICEAVAYQLSRLSTPCYEALRRASIFGCDFGLEVLTRPGESHEAVADLLEEAVRARILTRAPGVPRYRFCHRLVWEVLFDDLDPVDRAHRHAEALIRLEEHYGRHVDEHLAELFFHASAGVLAGTAAKAISYGNRAAQLAIQECAYEKAIDYCKEVLPVIELRSPRDDALHAEVMLRLGNALAELGRIDAAKETFRRVAAASRTAGLCEEQARAALAFGMAEEPVGVPASSELIDMLTDALRRVDDGPLRVRLLCRLGIGLAWSEAHERARELSAEAVALASKLGDGLSMALALLATHETEWTYENTAQRLQLDDEIVRLARTIPHAELLLLGLSGRVADRMELCGLAAVEADVQELEQEAERLQRPRHLWRVRALRGSMAWCEGLLPEAERLAIEAAEYGQQARQPVAEQVVSIQTWRLRTEQGRLDELRAAVEDYVRDYPGLRGWRCVLGHVYAELNLRAEAVDLLREIARNDWALLPQDRFRISALSSDALVCALGGAAARAGDLYLSLQPFADRHVVVPYQAAFLGSPAYYLGRLAVTMREWSLATRHFERALEQNSNVKPMLVRALYECAAVLHHTGRARRKARALCARGLRMAHEIGIVPMQRKLEVLLRDLDRSDAA